MAPQRIRKTFSGFTPNLQIDLKRPCTSTDSIHSTCRGQRDLQSRKDILHIEGKEIFYPSSLQDLTKAFQAFQPQGPSKGIPVFFQAFHPQDLPRASQYFNDIPDIPVIHDIQPSGITTCSSTSSTFQHLPVLSSTFQCIQGFHPIPAFSN